MRGHKRKGCATSIINRNIASFAASPGQIGSTDASAKHNGRRGRGAAVGRGYGGEGGVGHAVVFGVALESLDDAIVAFGAVFFDRVGFELGFFCGVVGGAVGVAGDGGW